jgi:hypothetical protein
VRAHDVSAMSSDELAHARRELAASLGLIRDGSPLRETLETHMDAIDVETAKRGRRIRLCSCGFGTSDGEWMDGHLFEKPGHVERTAEPMSAAWSGRAR